MNAQDFSPIMQLLCSLQEELSHLSRGSIEPLGGVFISDFSILFLLWQYIAAFFM
jgi:hypothetical protein